MEMITTWDAWCGVHADLAFWRDEIRAICRAHGVPLHQLGEVFPGTHAVFAVNDFILKIFCPVRYTTYDLELRLHRGPLAHNDLFPQVLFHGRSPSGYDYIAFTKLRGRSLREIEPACIGEWVAVELAKVLIAVQTATLSRRGADLCCLVHYDLTGDHVYLDRQGHLEGIIDWGDARMAHPSEEFPVLFVGCFRCDDVLIRAFQEAYNASCPHYQIRERDLVGPIQAYPFRTDIIADLRCCDTDFSRGMPGVLCG